MEICSQRERCHCLREGFKRARGLAHHSEMDPFRGDEVAPGCSVATDAEIDAWIRTVAITANHPCGTCTMAGEAPVLDPELRVLGIEHLRVVDASAMPDLVSGNINACVLMMAEKAADLIDLKRKFNRERPRGLARGRQSSPYGCRCFECGANIAKWHGRRCWNSGGSQPSGHQRQASQRRRGA